MEAVGKWRVRVVVEHRNDGTVVQTVSVRGLGTVTVPVQVRVLVFPADPVPVAADLPDGLFVHVVVIGDDDVVVGTADDGTDIWGRARTCEVRVGRGHLIISDHGILPMTLRQAFREWAEVVTALVAEERAS